MKVEQHHSQRRIGGYGGYWRNIVILLVGAIALGGMMVGRASCGARFGDACLHASDCRGLGSDCVRVDDATGYCTQRCAAVDDCPPAFRCRDHLRAGDSQPERVCVRVAPNR